MKKIILSIALAALSFGAYATNYSRSGVEAQVGGWVGSYSGSLNGYQRSSISMRSSAGAFSISGRSGHDYGTGFCGLNWDSHSDSGAYTLGGAYSNSWGVSSGDGAEGVNFGYAAYQGSATQNNSDLRGGLETGTGADVWAEGAASTRVDLSGDDWGFSIMGTASGAYANASANASRDYFGKSHADGSAYGGSGSITGGLTLGSAEGIAGSGAGHWGWADSYATDGSGYLVSRAWGDVDVDGSAWSEVDHHDSNGANLAGSYTLQSGTYTATGKDYRWLGLGTSAFVADTKFSVSDSVNWGTPGLGDAETGGFVNVGAERPDTGVYARAGNLVIFETPEP